MMSKQLKTRVGGLTKYLPPLYMPILSNHCKRQPPTIGSDLCSKVNFTPKKVIALPSLGFSGRFLA